MRKYEEKDRRNFNIIDWYIYIYKILSDKLISDMIDLLKEWIRVTITILLLISFPIWLLIIPIIGYLNYRIVKNTRNL
jgi:hypothetical protein